MLVKKIIIMSCIMVPCYDNRTRQDSKFCKVINRPVISCAHSSIQKSLEPLQVRMTVDFESDRFVMNADPNLI